MRLQCRLCRTHRITDNDAAAISDDDEIESDGGPDTIPARGKIPTKADEPEEEAEDEDDDDEDEEEFRVEKILKHDFAESGAVLYQIKWLGYDKKSDLTWEPVENLYVLPVCERSAPDVGWTATDMRVGKMRSISSANIMTKLVGSQPRRNHKRAKPRSRPSGQQVMRSKHRLIRPLSNRALRNAAGSPVTRTEQPHHASPKSERSYQKVHGKNTSCVSPVFWKRRMYQRKALKEGTRKTCWVCLNGIPAGRRNTVSRCCGESAHRGCSTTMKAICTFLHPKRAHERSREQVQHPRLLASTNITLTASFSPKKFRVIRWTITRKHKLVHCVPHCYNHT